MMPKSLKRSATFLLILALMGFGLVNTELIIESNDTTIRRTLAQEYFEGTQPLAYPMSTSSLYFSWNLTTDNLTNAFLLFQITPGVPFVDNLPDIKRYQDLGPLAIVCNARGNEVGRYSLNPGLTSIYTVKLFSVAEADFTTLRAAAEALVLSGEPYAATITPGNYNIWKTAATSVYAAVWYALVSAVFLSVFIFAMVRMVFVVKARGCHVTIATVALSMDLLGSFVGTLYWAIDPNGIRGIYPRAVFQIFFTFPLPFLFGADLLVILFWIEILSGKMQHLNKLKRLRKPYIAMVSYICIAEIVLSVCRIFLSSSILTIVSVVNIVVTLLIIFVTSIILMRSITYNQEYSLLSTSRLSMMKRHMIIMAALAALSIISFAILILPFVSANPWIDTTVLGIVIFIVCAIQLNQVYLFRSSGRKFKAAFSSTSDSGSTKQKTGSSSGISNPTHKSSELTTVETTSAATVSLNQSKSSLDVSVESSSSSYSNSSVQNDNSGSLSSQKKLEVEESEQSNGVKTSASGTVSSSNSSVSDSSSSKS